MLIYLQMIESEEDKSKFEALYNQYKQAMYAAAYRVVKNQYDAEDAVHQAFLSLIKNLDKIKPVDCPETRSYVVITSENKAIGLADAMAKLPARYREVLLLRFDNGFSTREIAKMMGTNEGNMQKLIWRAKEALRKQLDKDNGGV